MAKVQHEVEAEHSEDEEKEERTADWEDKAL